MHNLICKRFENYRYKKVENTNCTVFLHGWGANLDSFLEYEKEIGKSKSTLTFDFAGFNSSAEFEDGNLNDYAMRLFNILKYEEIKKINIVCHSFGGRVAICFYNMFPQLVSSIAFICSAGVKPRFNLLTYTKIKYYKLLKYLVKKNIINIKHLKNLGSKDYKELSPNMKKVFTKIVNTDLTPFLSHIQCPVILIWGKKDRDTPVYMAKIFKKNIKNSTLYLLNGGHFCYQNEKIKVMMLLKDFWEKENV